MEVNLLLRATLRRWKSYTLVQWKLSCLVWSKYGGGLSVFKVASHTAISTINFHFKWDGFYNKKRYFKSITFACWGKRKRFRFIHFVVVFPFFYCYITEGQVDDGANHSNRWFTFILNYYHFNLLSRLRLLMIICYCVRFVVMIDGSNDFLTMLLTVYLLNKLFI